MYLLGFLYYKGDIYWNLREAYSIPMNTIRRVSSIQEEARYISILHSSIQGVGYTALNFLNDQCAEGNLKLNRCKKWRSVSSAHGHGTFLK